MAKKREFELILFGATGFTGGLTAEYLATHAPTTLRWALAGRNQAKLTAVRESLTKLNPNLAELPLVIVDAADSESLQTLVARTKVVVSTVGPYVQHGEPLVAACASAGTDYLDLTGEPEFVDDMYLKYHQTAVASGARLIHASGFDSVPHDLGAWFTMQHLTRHDEPVKLRGVVRVGAQFSGGTLHSALLAISRQKQASALFKQRRHVEGSPVGRRVKAVLGRPSRDKLLGYWLVPLPVIDPIIVARTAAQSTDYGPDFSYSHYAGVKTLRMLAGGAVGLSAIATAAQVPLLRNLLLNRVPAGTGPSQERRAKSWFKVEFVAETPTQLVRTRVSGGDPGYGETSKMLAEAALCLIFDDNPKLVGQQTPAAAMASNLLNRLQQAGIKFEVVKSS